jgi:hypothetical protein
MEWMHKTFGAFLSFIPITFVLLTGGISLLLAPYLPIPALVLLTLALLAVFTYAFRIGVLPEWWRIATQEITGYLHAIWSTLRGWV